jgi:T-lymphoma invasion and metastasis-inducing protein 1
MGPGPAGSLPRGYNNGSQRAAAAAAVSMGNRARNLAAESLRQNLERSLYLDFERGDAASPPSDNIMFDHMCYATTPSSSNGNSDLENPPTGSMNNHGNSNAASPTSRLLLEYEMHLRNTLAKGMDAESCSLHTFEALLTQSMENLGKSSGHFSLPLS